MLIIAKAEIVKMLEEIKGKITQGQLTEEDQSNFKVLNQGFRSFLASKNSEHAHSHPYVHQLNAELIHVEQLLK